MIGPDYTRERCLMSDTWTAEIEYAVAELVRRLTATRPHNRDVAALDRSAYLILHEVLHTPEPVTIQALARRLHVDVSTMSRQIAAMTRKELVARVPLADSPRVHGVRATPLGYTAFDAMRAARQTVYREILREWSAADQAHLALALQRLNQSIRHYQDRHRRDAPPD